VKTLEAIHEADDSLNLTIIMGSDVYLDLPKWKDPKMLAELSTIVVYLREGSPLSELSRVSVPARIHDRFVLPHIKSTVIREMVQQGHSELSFIDQSVLNYALKHNLY
jgi:nicotinic acid mononucleotide adenylyltransferase